MAEAHFETLRVQDGAPQHISYHAARLNRTRKELYGIHGPIDLETYARNAIRHASHPLSKLRLIYNVSGILSHTLTPYVPKLITTITLVEANIDYPHKSIDRAALDALTEAHPSVDEILIATHGYLRDTTIANIALRQNGIWYTPAEPILPGTTRARLLDTGVLHPRHIHRDDLGDYDQLALMNAMTGFVPYPLSILLH